MEIRTFGDGAPVVFLHGCPTTVDVLDDVAGAVATKRRSLVVSLPGYGRSPALAPPWTVAALHDAIAAAIDAAGARGAWLVGFSGGAYHALAIASDARVRAAGVVTLGGMLGFSDQRAQMRDFAAAVAAGADLHHVAGPRFLSERYRDAHPEAVRKVEAWLDATSPENLAAELRAFADAPDLTERVAALDVPIVARVGELDVAAPPAGSEAIVRAAKRGALQIARGCGHALMIEDAEATSAAVLAAVTG